MARWGRSKWESAEDSMSLGNLLCELTRCGWLLGRIAGADPQVVKRFQRFLQLADRGLRPACLLRDGRA